MFGFLRDMGVLCDHKLEQVGTGYDDTVKCRSCTLERARRPGEVTETERMMQVAQEERRRYEASRPLPFDKKPKASPARFFR